MLRPGTVIATFDSDGLYGNHLDGRSHAAIYLGQGLIGIRVLDPLSGHTRQPVHERVIRFSAFITDWRRAPASHTAKTHPHTASSLPPTPYTRPGSVGYCANLHAWQARCPTVAIFLSGKGAEDSCRGGPNRPTSTAGLIWTRSR